MSLLAEIDAALRNQSAVELVMIKHQHVIGSFNTHEFMVAPSIAMDLEERKALFQELASLVPQEPTRVMGSFDMDSDPLGMLFQRDRDPDGFIYWKEEIGTEEVKRTFTVNDAIDHYGRSFSEGTHSPETSVLTRTIELIMYSSMDNLRLRSRTGRVVYEAPVSAT